MLAFSEPRLSTTVLIVGAGSTGLALAQGLRKAGIPSIVVEKHETLHAQSRDWNMGLHWGASSLKALLSEEQWARIQSVQVDPNEPTAEHDALKFFNGQSGEIMASIPARLFYRLRRRKLRDLMEQGLDVRYGKKLDAIEYSADGQYAVAIFEDGSSLLSKLIVGADGAQSKTRQLLLGPGLGQVRRLPYCATFVQAQYSAERARFLRQFHPLYLAGINPEGYFSFFGVHDATDRDKPETWTFFFYISWHSSLQEQKETAGWTNSQRLKQVKKFAQSFTDPWRSAFEWLPDDHQAWYMGLSDFDPRAKDHRWDNHGGRVTLAGDAAHAMTYQRGQGLNHSITDAANLVEAVRRMVCGTATQASAIADYEDEMIARAGGEVSLSTVNTVMLHDWQKVLQSPVLTSGMKRSSQDRN
ncbi:FAD-dependent oxidoreductase [Aspergillus ibericus CBS 121593]|uniref:FAD/NAD(P)-binding domain-containing protein n=1 Tax=Aspergillus ibericus CBS 121593 TaxID=1448316 RepID=A0A395GV53_9EURO|nr:FAD/NAD(P)-binding domain-containing protein [Aspergillus ibericus CBS 121593]RAK97983.1 FAD/NAD(P)-binding domain-containing protein [Aspergillus ibericus CBS 121593]